MKTLPWLSMSSCGYALAVASLWLPLAGCLLNDPGSRAGWTDQQTPVAPVPEAAASAPVQATRSLMMILSLDSRGGITNPGAGIVPQIDYSNPSTYNCATSVTVTAVNGQPEVLTFFFQKAGPDLWNVFVATWHPWSQTVDPRPLTAAPIAFGADGRALATGLHAVTVSIPGSVQLSLSLAGMTQHEAPFAVYGIGIDDGTPFGLATPPLPRPVS